MVTSFTVSIASAGYYLTSIPTHHYHNVYELYALPVAPLFAWLLWFWLESLIKNSEKELANLKRMAFAEDA